MNNIPNTPQELIKSLPKDLKDLLFKQWSAKQNPEWHPEGNTLKHIIVVLKRAYHHYPDDPNMIMAALFHDLGKVDTYQINPKTGQPTAYGHENKSTDYVEQYRSWIEGFEGTDVDEIKYLVQNHMKVKPSTWDSMKDTKKEPIRTNKSFDKLMGFTDKLDGGGSDIEKKKLQEAIRKVLREESKPHILKIRRKLGMIDYDVKRTLNVIYRPDKVCDAAIDDEEFLDVAITTTIENIFFHSFYNMDDNSQEWIEIYNFIYEYVKEKYSNKIKQYYNIHCKK